MTVNVISATIGLMLVAGALSASACHRHHTPTERAEWHAGLRPEQKAEAVEHIRTWMEYHDGGT